jgi:probable rRNA maturation factor
MKLSIQIEEQFDGYVKRRWLRTIVTKTLATAKVTPKVQLDLLITDDETVHTLNKTYRNVDRPTDVLAFALTEESSEREPFVSPPDEPAHLGEVIVSYPAAVRQADEHGHSVEQELAILVIHGVLHLLGSDHEESADEVKMRALEEKALTEVRGEQPRPPG